MDFALDNYYTILLSNLCDQQEFIYDKTILRYFKRYYLIKPYVNWILISEWYYWNIDWYYHVYLPDEFRRPAVDWELRFCVPPKSIPARWMTTQLDEHAFMSVFKFFAVFVWWGSDSIYALNDNINWMIPVSWVFLPSLSELSSPLLPLVSKGSLYLNLYLNS